MLAASTTIVNLRGRRDPYVFEVVRLLGVEVGWGGCRHDGYALEWRRNFAL
jgi:hypothetical protein